MTIQFVRLLQGGEVLHRLLADADVLCAVASHSILSCGHGSLVTRSRSFPRLGRAQCQRGKMMGGQETDSLCRKPVCLSSFSCVCVSATEPDLGSSAARLTCKGSPFAFSLLVARLAGTLASSISHEPMFQASSWGVNQLVYQNQSAPDTVVLCGVQ